MSMIFVACCALGAQQPIDLREQVAPLLRERCVVCHGPDEQKGDLRLDRRDALFGDDEDLWTVRPGQPDESELLRRVTLPAEDRDAMPRRGQRLTRQEVELVRRWIAEGASWPDGFTIEPPEPGDWLLPRASEEQLRARARALAQLARGAALVAHEIGDGTHAVALEAARGRTGELVVPDLEGLAPFVVKLDLARTRVRDAQLAELVAALPELRHVDLTDTAVGRDAIRALAKALRLEVVALVATPVGDDDVQALLEAPALRRVYLWRTRVTDTGITTLRHARPDVVFDRGDAAELLARKDLVGEPFGPFEHVEWIDAPIDFADSELTLIRWWTNTCPFCAASLPALDALAKRTDGLRVVGMFHPKPPREVPAEAVRRTARRLGFEGVLVQDPEWQLLRSLQARGLPRRATSVSVLVDRAGIVRWVHPGPRIHEDPTGEHAEAAASLRELETMSARVLREAGDRRK